CSDSGGRLSSRCPCPDQSSFARSRASDPLPTDALAELSAYLQYRTIQREFHGCHSRPPLAILGLLLVLHCIPKNPPQALMSRHFTQKVVALSFTARRWTTVLSACSIFILTFALIACGGSPKTASTGGVTPPSSPGSGSPAPAPPPSSSCPTVQVAIAQGPTTGTAPFPQPAPEPAPNPGSTSAGSVCVSTPSD